MDTKTTMKVIIAQLGKDIRTIEVPTGSTVRNALLTAGYKEEEVPKLAPGVRVNGGETTLGSRLEPDTFLAITPDVDGG